MVVQTGGEFNGDESNGIESVKNHQLNKQKIRSLLTKYFKSPRWLTPF